MGNRIEFVCWAEGIAWFRCLDCGRGWISQRELSDHSHYTKA